MSTLSIRYSVPWTYRCRVKVQPFSERNYRIFTTVPTTLQLSLLLQLNIGNQCSVNTSTLALDYSCLQCRPSVLLFCSVIIFAVSEVNWHASTAIMDFLASVVSLIVTGLAPPHRVRRGTTPTMMSQSMASCVQFVTRLLALAVTLAMSRARATTLLDTKGTYDMLPFPSKRHPELVQKDI